MSTHLELPVEILNEAARLRDTTGINLVPVVDIDGEHHATLDDLEHTVVALIEWRVPQAVAA